MVVVHGGRRRRWQRAAEASFVRWALLRRSWAFFADLSFSLQPLLLSPYKYAATGYRRHRAALRSRDRVPWRVVRRIEHRAELRRRRAGRLHALEASSWSTASSNCARVQRIDADSAAAAGQREAAPREFGEREVGLRGIGDERIGSVSVDMRAPNRACPMSWPGPVQRHGTPELPAAASPRAGRAAASLGS